MYGALYRALPGPRPVRVLLMLLLLAGALWVLWFHVFPWAALRFSVEPGSIESAGAAALPFARTSILFGR